MSDQAIIVAGNLSDGFRFIGPYEDWDEAAEASERLDTQSWIATLERPPIGGAAARLEKFIESGGDTDVLLEGLPNDPLQAAMDAGEAEGEFVGEHTEDISYKFDQDESE